MSTHALSFKNKTEILKYVEENDVRYVDFNFTDIRGQWQHITHHVSVFDKDMLDNGVYFDGSSIVGWRSIEQSDMILRPDVSRASLDPFAAQRTLKIFCDVYDPVTNQPYVCDPRSVARAAEDYLRKSGLGDAAYFGPELEFFVFDDARVFTEPHNSGFVLDSSEGPYNSGREYVTGNMGHRPPPKGGYVPDAPIDSLSDIRSEMLSVIESMGVPVEKHHHEVAPSQHELGIRFSTLMACADNVQIYKHAVKNVANSYGKTVTFMPKPMFGDNGSGMHVHQSVWKAGKPLFAGKNYAELSEDALYYIGGIMKHVQALNAFTNPTTNSYKRLIPGYEAPVLMAYSARNRSAACRIPQSASPKAKRIELRFPDPMANPYLAFSAMLMAGLDGIENKIHPGEAMDQDLYALSAEEKAKIPALCSSLEQSLHALQADHDFLLKGNVFSKELIESFITLKRTEVDALATRPHPVEFLLYFSG